MSSAKFLTRPTLLVTLALTATALAATSANRILKFEAKTYQGDLRNGPWTYTGQQNQPVKATVSSLGITAMKAVLSAPSGMPMASAEGKRTGVFDGSVVVTRGRLTAKGGTLTYSESEGQGVLSKSPSAVFVSDAKDGDPVNISAQSMSLDVDNNVSTSTGGVNLKSGAQSGASDKLVFDETKELAVLSGNLKMSRAASAKAKELVITGAEARVLTKSKTIYVKGGVKLIQGNVTTTGDAVYYDDKANLAYVVGNAVSVDSKSGAKVFGKTLKQRTDLARVDQYSGTYAIPTAQFKLTGER